MSDKGFLQTLENTPSDLVFEDPLDLSPENSTLEWQGDHRLWKVYPRQGTAWTDKWSLLGTPIPGGGNPAADMENGQFSTLQEAYNAMIHAEEVDTGTHLED